MQKKPPNNTIFLGKHFLLSYKGIKAKDVYRVNLQRKLLWFQGTSLGNSSTQRNSRWRKAQFPGNSQTAVLSRKPPDTGGFSLVIPLYLWPYFRLFAPANLYRAKVSSVPCISPHRHIAPQAYRSTGMSPKDQSVCRPGRFAVRAGHGRLCAIFCPASNPALCHPPLPYDLAPSDLTTSHFSPVGPAPSALIGIRNFTSRPCAIRPVRHPNFHQSSLRPPMILTDPAPTDTTPTATVRPILRQAIGRRR